ncbi:MAG: OmpA family protein [Roseovarius sp.]
MRLSSIFTISAIFVVAAVLCLVAAQFSVAVIEDTSRKDVRDRLDEQGMPWAEVDANGLQVFLAGTAPTEATRFKALSVAGTVVDAARVIDQMLVEDSAQIAPPRFSVEILRNDSGISLIGLVPASTDRDALLERIRDVSGGDELTDLLEVADYAHPETWESALTYAVNALKSLPRTKISVDASRVVITAMTDSSEEKRNVEINLARNVPKDVRLALNISAPRPVVTPYTLRFVLENEKARFDACTADTEAAQAIIVNAANALGHQGRPNCIIGLGVPSPNWGKAAEMSIAAVGDLGGGSVTFSDADVSLEALQGTPQSVFDAVVGNLENSLPDVFTLHSFLPPPVDNSAPEVPEFVATLSPEGLVQLRGRVGSDFMRETVDSFAKARFSSNSVHTTARVTEDLPSDWPLRTLAGLEALSYLSNGAVTVTPDLVNVIGNTGNQDASTVISGFLSEKLGEGKRFEIDVAYKKALDPVAGLPTPDECEALIAEVQKGRKINFEPGSSNIDSNGDAIMDDIADILKKCGTIRMEIGGHTDSQGRETMNQQLSQARARSVLEALRARRVLTGNITAKGYGEAQPIADNGTESGREENRRIEFKLIRLDTQDEQSALDRLAQPVEQEGDATAQSEEEGNTDEQN